MAVARPIRTARRRQTSWLQVVVFAVLAVVGGTALWTSLQYSEAHAAARASLDATQEKREVVRTEEPTDGSKEEEQGSGGSGGDGKSDPSASLAAWTELTALPGGSTDGGSTDDGSIDGSGTEEQQQQQQEEQPAEGGDDVGGSSSSGGSSEGSSEGGSSEGAQPGPGDAFVTVELRVPKAPPTYNSWVLAEDMLLFHQRALQQQLEQTYVALGLAAATGRAFVLPEFSCFCQNSDAPLKRCRRADSDSLQFPLPCPEAEVLAPLDRFSEPQGEGMPLKVLSHQALDSIATDESKVLVIKPSATILWPACTQPHPDPAVVVQCTFESGLEGGATQVLIPPSLNDTHLLPFLEPYKDKFPLWRLDLSDVGSHWHAFAGWDCGEPARQFDLRLRGVVQPWPRPAGGGMLPLNMTSGRIYSDEPDMKDCKSGAALRRMQAVRVVA